jgi:hypothetical protein
MVGFLEKDPKHFLLITQGKPVVAGTKLKASCGFEGMADFVNQKTGSNWTSKWPSFFSLITHDRCNHSN